MIFSISTFWDFYLCRIPDQIFRVLFICYFWRTEETAIVKGVKSWLCISVSLPQSTDWKKCSIWFNLVLQCIESVIAVCSGSKICQLKLQKILCGEELSFCFTLIFSYTCSCSPAEELVAKCHLLDKKNI